MNNVEVEITFNPSFVWGNGRDVVIFHNNLNNCSLTGPTLFLHFSFVKEVRIIDGFETRKFYIEQSKFSDKLY